MELACMPSLEQKQILSPQQIESLSILSMDWHEFTSFIIKEQEENPMIKPIDAPMPRIMRCALDDDELLHVAAPNDETPSEIILSQIDISGYSRAEADAILLIADSVDDSGFLARPLGELSALSDIPTAVFESCLAVLQKLTPVGICARGIEECLSIQARAAGYGDDIILAVIDNHLPDLAEGRIKQVAKALKTTPARIASALDKIRSLSPRPLNGLAGEPARPVVPDIVFSRREGEWVVELNDSWFEKLELCDYYESLASGSAEPELREYLGRKAARVRMLNAAIAKRRGTLLSIGRYVTERQGEFLLAGGSQQALTMTEVAVKLDISTSTVSRAVAGKYAQYPGGVVPLRTFFARGVAGNHIIASADMSRKGVKTQLRKLIEDEDRLNPYSDNYLTCLLRERGVSVSRRAVAKYRDEMGIRGMHERRYT